MKKIILALVATVIAFSASGQLNLKGSRPAVYYGVDISNARVYGNQSYSDNEIRVAFEQINLRMVTKNYKTLKSSFDLPFSDNISMVRERNHRTGQPGGLATEDRNYRIDDTKIREMVSSYKDTEGKGIGVVIIAELLDFSNSTGIYKVVFFDRTDNSVLYIREVAAKGGGREIDRFWEKSVKSVVSKWRYHNI